MLMGQTDETGCKPGYKQVWAEELIAKGNKIRIRKKFKELFQASPLGQNTKQ